MLTLFRLLAAWPLPLLHAVGAALGWCVWLVSPAYRRVWRSNTGVAGVAGADRWRSVAEAGKLVAELPRLWLGAPVPVVWDGAAHIDAARARGDGILFLTPHLGCFEVTAQAYAARYGGPQQPMTVLFRPPRQPWLRTLVETARQRPGLATASTTLSGVRQLIQALRAGGAVGLLPDQVPPHGLGVWAPFWGQPAYTMTLSARLAQTPHTTVLVAWGERLAWGRGYRVHVMPWAAVATAPLSADPAEAATQINAAMERVVRGCPAQYLWGYARFKSPKTPAARQAVTNHGR